MKTPTLYQQRQHTLHTLLLGSIGLSSIALIIVVLALILGRGSESLGNVVAGSSALLLFSLLYGAAKRGLNTFASYCFCGMYFLIGVYMILTWGIQLPEALLIFVLAIVTSGLVISTFAGVIFTVATCGAFVTVVIFHMHNLFYPDLSWSNHLGNFSDVIIFTLSLGIITITTWQSNSGISRSFEVAMQAEQDLQQERDQLEITIKLRTEELRIRQQAEIDHLYHFAYFGRASSTFLHDIVSPLFAVAVTLKRMEGSESSHLLRRAIGNMDRVEQYVKEAQRDYQNLPTIAHFNLYNEIEYACNALQERIGQENALVQCIAPKHFFISGDPLKFQRCLINLITNALDACTNQPDRQTHITISVILEGSQYTLSVLDNGPGIPLIDLGQIFDPFFSTKHNTSRMGIGLAICKEIIEHDFNGTINVQSTLEIGTKIICTFPSRT